MATEESSFESQPKTEEEAFPAVDSNSSAGSSMSPFLPVLSSLMPFPSQITRASAACANIAHAALESLPSVLPERTGAALLSSAAKGTRSTTEVSNGSRIVAPQLSPSLHKENVSVPIIKLSKRARKKLRKKYGPSFSETEMLNEEELEDVRKSKSSQCRAAQIITPNDYSRIVQVVNSPQLERIISERRWGYLVKPNQSYYPQEVREFYAFAEVVQINGEKRLTTSYGGGKRYVTKELIASLTGMEDAGDECDLDKQFSSEVMRNLCDNFWNRADGFTDKGLHASCLDHEYRILLDILHSNAAPTTEPMYANALDLKILLSLKMQFAFNMVDLFLRFMIKCASEPFPLCYPSLISAICREWKIPTPAEKTARARLLESSYLKELDMDQSRPRKRKKLGNPESSDVAETTLPDHLFMPEFFSRLFPSARQRNEMMIGLEQSKQHQQQNQAMHTASSHCSGSKSREDHFRNNRIKSEFEELEHQQKKIENKIIEVQAQQEQILETDGQYQHQMENLSVLIKDLNSMVFQLSADLKKVHSHLVHK